MHTYKSARTRRTDTHTHFAYDHSTDTDRRQHHSPPMVQTLVLCYIPFPFHASSTTLARRGEFEATESEDCNSSTATTPKGDYKDKRKLTFHKEDGKKTKFGTITDTWAASWEPKDHTKRGPPDATA